VRFTIERLRTLVLIAGVLLIVALIAFLARGKLKSRFKIQDIPGKLGLNIQSDLNGVTYDHPMGGHSRYRIHASKVAQYKDNHAILHDVQIELFGEDGSRVDSIAGAEFDYDQRAGKATAAGPVEITVMRPGVAPAIAPKAAAGKVAKGKATPIATAAETAERGQIHVKTSGLTFDTKSGVANTAEHVEFSMVQGSGSSTGASYDSKGFLILDSAVELNTERGGEKVLIRAQHAEFARDTHICTMHAATADYRGGEATAGDAKVVFRDDGSAVRLDAQNGFNMVTATGGHITAPVGSMDFDERNQPRHGHLQGGVAMDSTRAEKDGAGERRMHGTAPAADLDFTNKGQLRHAHLERGVAMQSELLSDSPTGPTRVRRTWTSPIADIDFRDNGQGQAEPSVIHGVQGVVVTGESQRGKGAPVPSRLAADEVTGTFAPNSVLESMVGNGHASLDETSAGGTHQSSTGDHLQVHFAPAGKSAASASNASTSQIQSAVLDGNVILTQTPAAKPGAQSPQAPVHAWAGRAEYEGAGEWLHLLDSPRVEDGGLQMTADKIDLSHETGDAFAHGNVKATWANAGTGKPPGLPNAVAPPALGGQGPSHVISSEAQLRQATGEATFRGHARLWQQANSVAAPVIILDRQKQTLVAQSADPGEPVIAILLSTGNPDHPANPRPETPDPGPLRGYPAHTPSKQSLITVTGGNLKYSDAERLAIMRAGSMGAVTAETPTASSASNEIDLVLLPAGNHAGKDGSQAQVDHMTALGHVAVTSDARRGTGEKLVYTGETGDYVLTGTSAVPPRMTDETRGTVTGAALVFNGRDDSVTVEGNGQKTSAHTTAPK